MNWRFALLVLVAIALVAIERLWVRRRLQAFRARGCMGRSWRRRFPQAPRTEIRAFLDLLVEAFGLPFARRLDFSPDDPLMELYRALNPAPGMPDAMELETLDLELEKAYGVRLDDCWRDGLTLGDLFSAVRERGQTA